jgi:hypothetical protein
MYSEIFSTTDFKILKLYNYGNVHCPSTGKVIVVRCARSLGTYCTTTPGKCMPLRCQCIRASSYEHVYTSYTCTRICTYTSLSHVYTQLHIYISIHVHIHMYPHKHIYIYIRMSIVNIDTYASWYNCTCPNIRTFIQTHSTSIQALVHSHIYAHAHV